MTEQCREAVTPGCVIANGPLFGYTPANGAMAAPQGLAEKAADGRVVPHRGTDARVTGAVAR
jgi:hypothetical protein